MLIQLDASSSFRSVFELKINVIKRETNGSHRASSLSILDERASKSTHFNEIILLGIFTRLKSTG